MHVSASCRARNMGRLSGKSKVLVSICRTVSEPDFHRIIQKSRFPAFRSRLLAVRKTFFTSFVRFCAENFFSLSKDCKIIRLRLNVKYTVLECIYSVYTVYLFILSRYLEAFFPAFLVGSHEKGRTNPIVRPYFGRVFISSTGPAGCLWYADLRLCFAR